MSAVLHMPSFTSSSYGLHDKNESFSPTFTSVNGRSSLSPTDEQKPPIAAGPKPWTPMPRPPGNSYHSPSSDSNASTVSSGDGSPDSPNKRRRSGSEEDDHFRPSPEGAVTASRQLPRPFQSTGRAGTAMEPPQQRNLPPLSRLETERRWATEPREMPHNNYQEFQRREPHPAEPFRAVSPTRMPGTSDPNELEDPTATEVTRAGVQVELKKRKRQFANRTKTGCGTCRRRKKKCDEAKPECNNCTRGGFVCEGYASKVPWPKNGATKPPPPLQAKERLPVEIPAAYARCPGCNQVHIPHCETSRNTQNTYPPEHHLPNGHERKSQPASTWTNSNWSEGPPPPPSRVSYQPEAQPPPATYPQPAANHHEGPPSHDRQVQQEASHNSRVYHHTPQSMSQPPTSTSVTTTVAKPAVAQHQVAQQHARPPPPPPPPVSASMVPATTAPPAPPPSHYAAPPPSIMYKSEKDKMLAGEPFSPYDRVLMDERKHCTGALYNFNATANPAVSIADEERRRIFKTIVAARWIPPPRNNRPPVVGHFGGNIHIEAPFQCVYGYNLSIAENVVIDANCHFVDAGRICIGRNTEIGARVTITTLKGRSDVKSLRGSNGTRVAAAVWIGENVSIGENCTIEAGVKIGDGAIVRPGSVVVSDIPRDCVARGNPAFVS